MATGQGGFGNSQGPPESDGESRDPPKFTRDDSCSPRIMRVKKDIADFFADPPPGIYIHPDETDVTKVHALMVGSETTPFEGGFFRLYIAFPTDYPMSPPTVTFLTTDAGRVSFNPHIYATGHICLNILGTNGQSWSPAQSLSSVLISVLSLLNENTGVKNNQEATSTYRTFLLHETIRVAVCDAVEDCLKDNSSFPAAFKDVVLKKFEDYYSKHEGEVKAHLGLTGTPMPYSGRPYQFETLLTRLLDLKERVAKKRAEDAAAVAAAAASFSF
ncbi:ubiquitin-conjugating enzyme E2 Z-like [Amblyomma americanum]|uniref:Ubiquitin-conjugating enzyme E2 Z n=1 Tax=Amblyomma americanum TaxID=6943 RepID=A0AAQ4F4H2_AMBAM